MSKKFSTGREQAAAVDDCASLLTAASRYAERSPCGAAVLDDGKQPSRFSRVNSAVEQTALLLQLGIPLVGGQATEEER